jgi:hypothetical protein
MYWRLVRTRIFMPLSLVEMAPVYPIKHSLLRQTI